MTARIAVLVVLAAVVIAFFATGGHEQLSFENLKERQAELEALYRDHPVLAPAVFFAIYVALATTSLPGGAVLTMIAGAIFGVALGTVIVSFASSIGATFAFLISRYLLRDWVERRFGHRLHRLNEGIAREGGLYLFMVRLVPAIPFLLVNVGMALTCMRTWKYYWISQAGMLSGSLLFANAGTRLAEIKAPGDALSVRMMIAFALLGIVPFAAKKGLEALRRRRATP